MNEEIEDPKKQIIVSDYMQEAISIINDIEAVLRLKWTEQENDILRRWYPSEGQKVVKRLPGRTVEACKTQAFKLGIRINDTGLD